MTARKAVNTNRQGANFELQIMHDLRRYGYTTLRSSGSKGTVDVVAVGDGHSLWIQAKITNPLISPAERLAVWDLALRAGGIPVVAHRDNGTVLYRELRGTGPKDWVPFEPYLSNRALCGFCEHRSDQHVRNGCSGQTVGCSCPTFMLQERKR